MCGYMLQQSDDFETAKELNLYFNEYYRLLKYSDNDRVVYISYTQIGNAITAHIAALNRVSKRLLRKAINETIKAFFMVYDWCEIIMVVVDKISVINLLRKLHFKLMKTYFVDNKNVSVLGIGRYGISN